MRFFVFVLEKLEKSYSHISSWGAPSQTLCLLLFYTLTTFLSSTVLALKHPNFVENEQNALVFHFRLECFYWWVAKILFAPGRSVP